MDPLALRAVGLDQPLAVAGEIPQLADGRRRHEAAPQQPTLQQLSQPGGIADVGLAAGQEFDVAGVDQQQLQPAFLQHLPDRFPVLAGRLHHHLGDALGLQPVGQCLQAGGERRIGADLLAASSPTPTDTNSVRDADGRPPPRPCRHPAPRPVPRSAPRLPPPTRSPVLVAPGRANRGNDAATRAHSNSSWCRQGPRVSLINGLSRTKESRAWPGPPDAHPSWRPPAMGVLSATGKCRQPLCGSPFPQVTVDRKGSRYAFNRRTGMRSICRGIATRCPADLGR